MIGRAAQGRPWIFREIAHFLATGTHLAPPLVSEVKRLLVDHLHDHYSLYDEFIGVRSARKHIGWYVRALPGGENFRAQMNLLEDSVAQVAAVEQFFDSLNETMDRIPAVAGDATLIAEEQDMNNTPNIGAGTAMRTSVEWAA
jgi:tRNA-dihydrouridine synthase B